MPVRDIDKEGRKIIYIGAQESNMSVLIYGTKKSYRAK